MEFNGPYFPKKTEKEILAYVEKIKSHIREGNFPEKPDRLIIAENNSNKIIGTVSKYWQSEATNWLSCGIAIYDEKYWGKGIGHEALGIWTGYLFDMHPEIVRLDMRTWSGNMGMMKLAEKLSYKLEAVFRKARIVNGEYFDSIGYGILKEEWEGKYPGGFLKYLE